MKADKASAEDAVKMASLMLRSNTWIHRRVERIVVEPTSECTRYISIDFTVPETLTVAGSCEGTILIPLGLNRKGPLACFSVRDSVGHPVPVLDTVANSEIAVDMLMELTKRISGVRDADLGDLEALVEEVVGHSGHSTYHFGDRVRDCLHDLNIEPEASRRLELLVLQFEKNFLMIAELDTDIVGKRSILKMEYRESRGQDDLEAHSPRLQWDLSDFGAAASVHVEFAPPPLLLIRSAKLIEYVESKGLRDGSDGAKTKLLAEMSDAGATMHLVARPNNRFSQAYVEATLVPRQFGAISAMSRGAWMVFIVVAGGLVVRWIRAAGYLPPGQLSPSISALMLALGGLLLTWLARSPEDWSTSRILANARRSLLSSAVLAGVVAVYLTIPVDEPYRTWGWGLLLLSALVNALVPTFVQYQRHARVV